MNSVIEFTLRFNRYLKWLPMAATIITNKANFINFFIINVKTLCSFQALKGEINMVTF